jgi:hypothetical protein
MSGRLEGIFMATCDDCTFFGNNISSSLPALSISGCENDSLFDNYVSSQSPDAAFTWYSYNDSIYDNDFVGGCEILNYNSSLLWDNGVEGNYWINYTGVDANRNGIGDTPYVLDSTDIDNYPLMGMFQSFNTSADQSVDVVSNSSVEDFEYVASNNTIMLQVSNATANQTAGFCRVRIPHTLMDPYNGSISVVVDNGQTPVLFLNSTVYDDGTSRWIYFTYPVSAHSVSISTVPEFPVFLVLALFMMGTIVAVAYGRRRMNMLCNSRSSCFF